MKVIGAMPERLALRSVTFNKIRLIEKVSHKKKPINYGKERELNTQPLNCILLTELKYTRGSINWPVEESAMNYS